MESNHPSSLSTVTSIAAGASSLVFSFIFVYMMSIFVVALSPADDDARYESALMANAALLGLGMAALFATVFSLIGEQIVATIMHMLQTSQDKRRAEPVANTPAHVSARGRFVCFESPKQ